MVNNMLVKITADAYIIDVQNNVSGVTTNVVSTAVLPGYVLSAEFTNNSGNAVFLYYYNTTDNTLIARFRVENGATQPVGYPMNNDLKIVISEIYKVTYNTNTVNSVKISNVDKTEAGVGETVTITLQNTSTGMFGGNKTVTVTFGNESKSVTVNKNGTNTVTFEMPAGDVTITIK